MSRADHYNFPYIDLATVNQILKQRISTSSIQYKKILTWIHIGRVRLSTYSRTVDSESICPKSYLLPDKSILKLRVIINSSTCSSCSLNYTKIKNLFRVPRHWRDFFPFQKNSYLIFSSIACNISFSSRQIIWGFHESQIDSYTYIAWFVRCEGHFNIIVVRRSVFKIDCRNIPEKNVKMTLMNYIIWLPLQSFSNCQYQKSEGEWFFR